jgi:hypothetical protein
MCLNLGDFLYREFAKPALHRILSLAEELRGDSDALGALEECMKTADDFMELLGSGKWREEVSEAVREGRSLDIPSFRRARERGKKLQQHLQTPFLSDRLRPFTEKYMIF